jgi:hypothetical protein|tara:strand:+ start:2623 stop:2922 length:300 start_codon:yes stop_codon:yes gene_type:complete
MNNRYKELSVGHQLAIDAIINSVASNPNPKNYSISMELARALSTNDLIQLILFSSDKIMIFPATNIKKGNCLELKYSDICLNGNSIQITINNQDWSEYE